MTSASKWCLRWVAVHSWRLFPGNAVPNTAHLRLGIRKSGLLRCAPMKFRHLLTLSGIAALALSFGGCQKASTDEILVGEFASLTGKEATFGISSHEGTVLAIEELNAAGGLLGKKLELLTEDTQSKAGEPRTVVNKLVSRDGVIALLG